MDNLHDVSELSIGGYYGYHNNTIGSAWVMVPTKHHNNGKVLVCLSNGNPQDRNPNINVDKYWVTLFDERIPAFYEFIPGGHFGISKEGIRIRTRGFYRKVLDMLTDDITAPWMIERLECYIFNPKYKTKL